MTKPKQGQSESNILSQTRSYLKSQFIIVTPEVGVTGPISPGGGYCLLVGDKKYEDGLWYNLLSFLLIHHRVFTEFVGFLSEKIMIDQISLSI